jgi:hypothetical protein
MTDVLLPSIPMPTTDPNKLYDTVMALKQLVEALTTGDTQVPVVHVHMDQPGPKSREGDFWLCKAGTSTTLSMLVAGQWVPVGNLR